MSSTAVRSVTPYHAPDLVPLLRNAAALLARDMDDPLFHHNEHRNVVASDQIDRLHDEARAKTTGFRSALRQLNRVTNVSSCRRQAKGVHGSHSASGSSASAAACL